MEKKAGHPSRLPDIRARLTRCAPVCIDVSKKLTPIGCGARLRLERGTSEGNLVERSTSLPNALKFAIVVSAMFVTASAVKNPDAR